MKSPTNPTGWMLVGVLFICIILTPSTGLEQPNAREQLNRLIEQQQDSPDLGKLKVGAETINFPWASQEDPHVLPNLPGFRSAPPKNEEIILDSANPIANVKDISATNAQVQRDVTFKDSQEKDMDKEGLENSQEISVNGKDNDESDEKANSIGGRGPDNNKRHNAENYLSIDVHDISVSAINTMQGGNAVATSNIIIEPVQIIVCPSEIGTKLA